MTVLSVSDLPSPVAINWLGHLNVLKQPNMHLQLREWASQFDGIYRIRLAHQTAVVISERQIVQQILKCRPEKFRRYRAIESVFSGLNINGIFSAEGDNWKRQRKLINPAFNGENLRYFFPSMSDISNRMIEKTAVLSQTQESCDIKHLFTQYTVDLIGKLAFGYDIDTLSGKNQVLHHHLATVFPGLNTRIASPLPLWKLYKTRKDHLLEAANAFIRDFLQMRISETKERLFQQPDLHQHPENLLQAMVAQQNLSEESLSDEMILANAVTLLLAGEDTTANSLAWLCHLLSTRDDLQDQLFSEINDLPDDALSQWPQPSLPLLIACIHESMRVKPVVPMLFTEPLSDITVNERLHLKKGTRTILLLNAQGDDKDRFDSPRTFHPERWLNDHPCRINDMMPFGGGLRLCPGRSLALLEMKLAMSRLIQQFKLIPLDADKVTERFDFIVVPDHLRILFELRR
ncbi:Bifunctional cytochrome P450/NADPH--P450 reductase [invertebrate metagenome]|uniref:Bifunctional cytochrome P450/NADPH--P450 reductase n=1 Tax=invertebrate metagenome TaxID=1711999 RepID=A0A2H9T8P1_9ZZZZ